MCNAWNHSADCTCGWGGTGHKGNVKVGTGRINAGVPPIRLMYDSFVIPNALCPICKQHVFFYQSPNGGRVFFDELGPPWQKHPCMNQQSRPQNIADSAVARKFATTKNYGWQKDGWGPFFIKSLTRVDLHTLRIIGLSGDDEVILFATSRLKRHGQFELIESADLIHLRPRDKKTYEISIYYEDKKFIGLLYTSELAARNGEDLNHKYLLQMPVGKLRKYVPKSNPKRVVKV